VHTWASGEVLIRCDTEHNNQQSGLIVFARKKIELDVCDFRNDSFATKNQEKWVFVLNIRGRKHEWGGHS